MKNIRGIWLPDHEEHLLMFATHDGWSYQKHKLDEALKYVKKFDQAIDIGGHCGLWSKHLVERFKHVHAFEPVEAHRQCYVKNVLADNYTLHPVGLGNREMRASMNTRHGSSGDSSLMKGDDFDVKLLDSFGLTPDFIKIDTEGFEYYICAGGEKTIREHMPTIIVEQKPGKGGSFGLKDTQAVDLLLSWGYECVKVMSGDYLMVCKQS